MRIRIMIRHKAILVKTAVALLVAISVVNLKYDTGFAKKIIDYEVESKGPNLVEYKRGIRDHDHGHEIHSMHEMWVDREELMEEEEEEEEVGEQYDQVAQSDVGIEDEEQIMLEPIEQNDQVEEPGIEEEMPEEDDDNDDQGFVALDMSKEQQEEVLLGMIEGDDKDEEEPMLQSSEEDGHVGEEEISPTEDDDSVNKNSGNQEDTMHPIDEFLAKETTEGSSLNTALKFLKDHSLPEAYGDEIDTEEKVFAEKSRCARYGYEYDPAISRRRRIFMGSLIADDSWHAISAHAAEAHGLYHTVSFIESNTTQTMLKRETKFDEGSLNYRMLQSGVFGPKTDVYVDFREDLAKDYPELDAFRRENLQRSHIIQRWADAGMQPEDVGIICDVDEVFTRDFLLALQTCDIPEFRPGQDCEQSQLTGQGLKFEMAPQCFAPSGFYTHPDVIIGECIEQVGDAEVHTPGCRKFETYEGGHLIGKRLFYDKFPERTMFPLWSAWDIRRSPDKPVLEDGRLHTAFHFHNFFDSISVLRNKYKTFAHNVEGADILPLSQVQRSAKNAIACIKGESKKQKSYFEIEGRRPILFENEAYRIARRKEMRDEIEEDERMIADLVQAGETG